MDLQEILSLPRQVDALLGIQPSPQREARARVMEPPPIGDRQLRRKPTRRVFFDASRARCAIDTLKGLPGPGETWHHLMSGAYDGFDLIPAIIEHAGCSIRSLHLATLGYNSANADRLIQMLDTGLIGRACMIVSTYYEADPKEADVCYRLSVDLPARGGWYCATRSHAKVIAAETVDGRCFTIESSANLRSCRNIEQFSISHDRPLLEFHRTWMEEAREATEARKHAR